MMRPGDLQNLIRFNTRMGMFICPSDRSNVVAFLHGYEYGTAGECRFTEILRQHLAEKGDIADCFKAQRRPGAHHVPCHGSRRRAPADREAGKLRR
jgi:hypothetical protein